MTVKTTKICTYRAKQKQQVHDMLAQAKVWAPVSVVFRYVSYIISVK